MLGGQRFVGVELTEHHHKFIAAEARHGVHFAQAFGQARGHLDQQQVAYAMPVRVIERFEVVQVQKHQRCVKPAALAGRHRLAQAVTKHAAVGQPGEGVNVGHLAHLVFHGLAFADVGEQ